MKNRPNLVEKSANSLVLHDLECKQQGLRILARIIARNSMGSVPDPEKKHSQEDTFQLESNQDE